MSAGPLADRYATFRGSTWFLLILGAAICGSFLAHFTVGFDPDWGVTNLGLSVEASMSVAMLIRTQTQEDDARKKLLGYMLHIMEAVHAQHAAHECLTDEVKKSLNLAKHSP